MNPKSPDSQMIKSEIGFIDKSYLKRKQTRVTEYSNRHYKLNQIQGEKIKKQTKIKQI